MQSALWVRGHPRNCGTDEETRRAHDAHRSFAAGRWARTRAVYELGRSNSKNGLARDALAATWCTRALVRGPRSAATASSPTCSPVLGRGRPGALAGDWGLATGDLVHELAARSIALCSRYRAARR